MSPHEAVALAYSARQRQVRLAAMLFRSMGFQLNRSSLNRLAMRIGYNGGDWHAAARREAIYVLHLALCPNRTIWRGKGWREPFTIGL
ncbi:hypothetical protein [Shinella sumterensis]|uniref:Uncharacterized protein n=1 Tax=Shinella sumterensis TaxID=1967501 RepID=A0AA50DES1_9HYPH|nr:hypothetical protein [Shinella sumterensis]WLS01011.1 hypothetical protein Q9313_26815 [Shinella sumterensis]WLS11794.1 hypothetical protein Q9314_27575 [Shinella sumterensis]